MSSQNQVSAIGTPIAEIEPDVALIHSLLAEQHPDLQHLPLEPIEAGWDNVMFRLGNRLAVRLPRRTIAATLIETEQIWLPQLAEQLPIQVPTPYRIGKPGQGYPWRWSVVPWLVGVAADRSAPHANQVRRFVSFLRSLHVPAPLNAPRNKFRCVPLQQKVAAMTERMERLKANTNLITPAIEQTWHRAVDATIDVQPTWIHGDLHARNVLIADGTISGIIDWGDMTVGDPATDLAAIWMLFADHQARQEAISEYTCGSEATWQRALGWAIFFGVFLLDTGLVDCPRHAMMGEKTLRRVAEER